MKIFIIFLTGFIIGLLSFAPLCDLLFSWESSAPVVIDVSAGNMDFQKMKAMEAQTTKVAHDRAYKQMEDFCGKDNVWSGGWDNDNYGVFGCTDYTIVKLKN